MPCLTGVRLPLVFIGIVVTFAGFPCSVAVDDRQRKMPEMNLHLMGYGTGRCFCAPVFHGATPQFWERSDGS